MNDVTLVPDLLTERVRRDPAAPFVTHYGSATERTELSARTFSNWADKTANLLVDECDLAPGDRVRLALLDEAPGHWMTLVWVMGAWRAGLTVTDGASDLVVTGPRADGGPDSYACSLHPLGLGLRNLPPGVRDFSSDALAQPDLWYGEGPSPTAPAWDVGGRTAIHAEVARLPGRAGRTAVTHPADPWHLVTAALIAPLVGTGSTLLLPAALDAAARRRIEEAEL